MLNKIPLLTIQTLVDNNYRHFNTVRGNASEGCKVYILSHRFKGTFKSRAGSLNFSSYISIVVKDGK